MWRREHHWLACSNAPDVCHCRVMQTACFQPPLHALSCLALQGGNGIAWSSAMWVIICESQSLAVRPAAVALCIAAFNLAASVLESKLLCVLQPLYHVVVLVVSFIAVVGRSSTPLHQHNASSINWAICL